MNTNFVFHSLLPVHMSQVKCVSIQWPLSPFTLCVFLLCWNSSLTETWQVLSLPFQGVALTPYQSGLYFKGPGVFLLDCLCPFMLLHCPLYLISHISCIIKDYMFISCRTHLWSLHSLAHKHKNRYSTLTLYKMHMNACYLQDINYV